MAQRTKPTRRHPQGRVKTKAKARPAARKGPPAEPLSFGQLCSAAAMLGLVPPYGPIAGDKVSEMLAKTMGQRFVKREGGKYHLA